MKNSNIKPAHPIMYYLSTSILYILAFVLMVLFVPIIWYQNGSITALWIVFLYIGLILFILYLIRECRWFFGGQVYMKKLAKQEKYWSMKEFIQQYESEHKKDIENHKKYIKYKKELRKYK